MTKKVDEHEKQAAARAAREQGKAPSEVGATTGSQQQRDHESHKERSHEDGPRRGRNEHEDGR
jgi:hypothetical protein